MDGSQSGRLAGSRRASLGGLFPGNNTGGRAASQTSVKKQAVKRHHHKHNLKHRYEFLETLGKGTYGKVKKARERSGRLVSRTLRPRLWSRVASTAQRLLEPRRPPVASTKALFLGLTSGDLLHLDLLI